MTNGDDEDVRFNVQMPERLRDDAKRNTERGELSEDVRELFRRKAYGLPGTDDNTELERTKAELQEVRDRIDDLRQERRRIDAEIETQESRATRLEERVERLEDETDAFSTVVETLEELLLDGTRIYPERIDDNVDAERVIAELKERNPGVPDAAFRLAQPHEYVDWREDCDNYTPE
jgi:chromosome segregation ATPase